MCFSVSDEIRLRSEIKTAKAELQGYKEQMESNTKERDDFERQTKEKESNLEGQIDEQKEKIVYVSQPSYPSVPFWGQGPVWRGPIPGGRPWGRRRGRRRRRGRFWL